MTPINLHLDDLIIEGIRVFLMLSVPIILAAAVSGTCISFLQTVTSIEDNATVYAVRFIVVVVTVYLMFPTYSQNILNLAKHSFSP